MTPGEVAEARARADAAPEDLRLQLEAAYACDRWGREEDAIVYYDRAYPRRAEVGDDAARAKLVLGYGSTLRNVGRLDESRAVLEAAVAERPEDAALPAFLALTLLELGRPDRAVAVLLDTLLLTGRDRPEIARYARALAEYRDDLRGPAR